MSRSLARLLLVVALTAALSWARDGVLAEPAGVSEADWAEDDAECAGGGDCALGLRQLRAALAAHGGDAGGSELHVAAAAAAAPAGGEEAAPSRGTVPGPELNKRAQTIFSQVRVPAALLAGLSVGQAFAVSFDLEDDFKTAILKRFYVLLAMASVIAQLITVVASTAALLRLVNCDGNEPAARNAGEFLMKTFPLAFVSSIFNFMAGLELFLLAIALRSYISIVCPPTRRTAVFLCLFGLVAIAALERIFLPDLTNTGSLAQLGFVYFKLAFEGGGFILGVGILALGVAAVASLVYMVVHIWEFTSKRALETSTEDAGSSS